MTKCLRILIVFSNAYHLKFDLKCYIFNELLLTECQLALPNETSILENLILILEFREFSRMRAASGFENEIEGVLKNP